MTPLTSTEEQGLFGRTADIERIVENCLCERLTVITAEPGCGTTSLLLAGLEPELDRHGLIRVYFREWQGRFSLSNLKEAIAKAVREKADPNFYGHVEQLHEMVARIRARTGTAVALLLDDFHDYLTAHQGTDLANSFDAELSNLLSGREGRVVMALHDCALPLLERLRQHVPNLLGHQYILSPLSEADARQMANARAEAAGLYFEQGCLDELLGSPALNHPAGFHPFHLSLVLNCLFERERRLKSNQIRLGTLRKSGGPVTLIDESMDSKIEEMGSTHKELFFRWCNLLISKSKTRENVPERKLMEFSGHLNRFALTLLPRVTELQILSPFDVNGTACYRIAREPLVAILRNWWERREAAIVARRKAIFRITSISLAVGSIVLVYVIFLLMPTPK